MTGCLTASIVWRAAKSAGRIVTEKEIRYATGLGVGTVNRWVRRLEEHKLMVRSNPLPLSGNGPGLLPAGWHAVGTIEQVHRLFGSPAPRLKPISRHPTGRLRYFGEDVGRVTSVFDLARDVYA